MVGEELRADLGSYLDVKFLKDPCQDSDPHCLSVFCKWAENFGDDEVVSLCLTLNRFRHRFMMWEPESDEKCELCYIIWSAQSGRVPFYRLLRETDHAWSLKYRSRWLWSKRAVERQEFLSDLPLPIGIQVLGSYPVFSASFTHTGEHSH